VITGIPYVYLWKLPVEVIVQVVDLRRFTSICINDSYYIKLRRIYIYIYIYIYIFRVHWMYIKLPERTSDYIGVALESFIFYVEVTSNLRRCLTRTHAFLMNNTYTSFVEQGGMSSRSTRGYVFLFNEKTPLLVGHEDVSSCRTRRHAFLLDQRRHLRVEHEDISSCKTEYMCSCSTQKTCRLVEREHNSSC